MLTLELPLTWRDPAQQPAALHIPDDELAEYVDMLLPQLQAAGYFPILRSNGGHIFVSNGRLNANRTLRDVPSQQLSNQAQAIHQGQGNHQQ